jgi:hypothetical protein
MKSWNCNHQELSGSVQVCTKTALPLPYFQKESDSRLRFWASVARRFVNDELDRFWNQTAVLLSPYLPEGIGGINRVMYNNCE